MRASTNNKRTNGKNSTGAALWADKRNERQAKQGQALCDEAMDALRRGNMEEAKRLATLALKTNIDKGRAASILTAIVFLDQGSYDTAQHYINQGLPTAKEESYRLYLLAAQSIVNRQWEKALEQSIAAFNADVENDLAGLTAAAAKRILGDGALAYHTYRHVLDHRWSNPILVDEMLSCLESAKVHGYDEDMVQGAQIYLDRPDLNPDTISPLVSSLLATKYCLPDCSGVQFKPAAGGSINGISYHNDTQTQLQEVARDSFFIDALNKTILLSPKIVSLLLKLRRSLRSIISETSQIPDEFLSLTCAMANQSFQTEYIGFIEEDEGEILSSLASVLDEEILEGSGNLTNLAPLFLLYAMYLPLKGLKCFEKLGTFPLNHWPPPVRPLIQLLVLELLEERALSGSVPNLAPIEDDISRKVREQYEESPYPRWTHMATPQKPISYGQRAYLQFSIIGPDREADLGPGGFPYSGNHEVLIAGCGTGQHPLRVAADCPDLSIVALDLSRASLGYAKKMALRQGIRNVEFLHGDILDVHALGKTFPAIESIGVLHHMEDPNQGLAALRNILAPRGLLVLGLYSERAREGVVAIRKYIEAMGLDPSAENIRRVRHQILTKEKFSEFSTPWKDLYNMNGVRDLLFHVQEHRFTPLQLKALCEAHNLKFLGFVSLKAKTVAAYRELFPEDLEMTSLSNWDRFEQANPQTFISMLKFICQAV
jgi:SAM-dependent methyltransferase